MISNEEASRMGQASNVTQRLFTLIETAYKVNTNHESCENQKTKLLLDLAAAQEKIQHLNDQSNSHVCWNGNQPQPKWIEEFARWNFFPFYFQTDVVFNLLTRWQLEKENHLFFSFPFCNFYYCFKSHEHFKIEAIFIMNGWKWSADCLSIDRWIGREQNGKWINFRHPISFSVPNSPVILKNY